MEFEFKGGNSVVITIKKTSIVIDPKVSLIGLKDQAEKADIVLLTQPKFATTFRDDALVIDGPGEYEVENISIKGVPAIAYSDPKGSPMNATMYRLDIADLSVVIVGHVHPDLTEEQFENLGLAGVLIVPIGGNGYTLDANGAVQLVPQAPLGDFVKELSATLQEASSKFKLKAGALSDTLVIQPLARTT
jgi:L-ascorbate metabolism protein UlaG (beta-lactamase superfamily)